MTRLVVRLLGGYRVELDGEAVYGFETDKARALLAYLIVEADRPHRRETLASLLWPDRPDTAARTCLRQALASVRRALSDHASRGDGAPFFILATPTDVQFNAASDYSLDVAALEAFARAPLSRPRLLPEALCADFLAGFAVPDSEAFQEWVLNRQEHYHRLVLEILDDQNAAFEAAGDYEQAVAAARRQLQMEPWLEEAHRRCMRGLALAGRRDEALHQYELCRLALLAELEAEPAESTQALHADIRAGRLVVSAQRPVRSLASVAGARAARSDTRLGASPVKLVAREDELGQLEGYLEAALAGETGVVFISGDAGSGKSTLLEAFAASAMAEHPDLLVAGARCNPGGSLDAFAPLRRLAEMLFGDLASPAAWRFHGFDQGVRWDVATDLALAALKNHGTGLVNTLIPAASVACRGGRFVTPVTPAPTGTPLSQGSLFDQLLSTLAAIAREQPLLLLLDDLHWVDDATAAFLVHLGRQLNDSRLLVLGAYRSATVALGRRDPRSGETIRHPLAAVVNELRRANGEIVVDLDRANGRAFVEGYVDTEPNRLGARFRDALYAQTGGHALFTVETLRNLQARGELFKDEVGRWVVHESLDWGQLPVRVEAAIAERIDRLPEGQRQILSAASVQGDTFSGELVAELTGAPVPQVLGCLSDSLARRHHIVRPEGLQHASDSRHSIYRFTHHLFQKYFYDQLDPVERARWHAAIATTLDRQAGTDPAQRERLAAQLAWHYEAGGLPLQAARALLDAGQQAMRVSAYREALSHYDHGLALLAGEPPSRECTEVLRLLEVARLGPERNLDGIGGDHVQGALARAAAAWAAAEGESRGGETATGGALGRPRLLMLAAQLERSTFIGQFDDALVAAERLRDEATQAGEEDLAAFAHIYFAIVDQWMGNLRQAEERLEQLLAWVTPERRARLYATNGVDLLATALGLSALNRCFLGQWEQALGRGREAMAAARGEAATVGQAVAAAYAAQVLFLLRGDDAAMREHSERCHRLCVQQGLSMWKVLAEILLGRVMVIAGDDLVGVDRILRAGWQTGSIVAQIDFIAVVLADSCLLAAGRRLGGNPAAAEERERLLATGLAAVENKLGRARVPSQQAYEAELRRLRGELLMARGGLAAAEEALDCFRQAMQLGREQGALAWELRAAMSVVRLRQRQGHAEELAKARAGLRSVCERFTEGFAYPDLQDAAALI